MFQSDDKLPINSRRRVNSIVGKNEMGKKTQNDFIDNRASAVAQRKLQSGIQNAPPSVIQRAISHDNPDFSPSGVRAGRVQVQNIRGEPYGEGANSPSVNPYGWNQLHADGQTLGNANSTHYNAVRMHLWNGRLGGPGNDVLNLAPGPAQINSSMSAGPETAAKNAVENNYRIWLDTRVEYQSGDTNPNDFTAVVPNRMRMLWGYMEMDNGETAEKILPDGRSIAGRGPAVGTPWQLDIDQPEGAMTDLKKAEYADLDGTDVIGLVDLFNNTSVQEKAQAFDQVAGPLKVFILQHYPDVYLSMDGTKRATILSNLSSQDAFALIGLTIIPLEPLAVYKEFYVPLISTGNDGVLRQIFRRFNDNIKKDQIKQGKTNLLDALGDTAKGLVWTNYSLFKYLNPATQANYMTDLSNTSNGILLEMLLMSADSGTIRQKLLNNWTKRMGLVAAIDKVKFVKSKAPTRYSKEFHTKMRSQIRNDKQFGQGNKRVSKRTKKKTNYF